jgi:hypothetical protein
VSDFTAPAGIPIVTHRWIPLGTAYLIGGTLYLGFWVPPRRYRPVGQIIAMQRRRRGK